MSSITGSFLINPQVYQKLKPLGQGGFSDVFLCKDTTKHDSSLFAVKYIRANFFDPNSQKSILREINILSKVHHPSILGLRGYYIPSSPTDNPVIVTDYVQNGSLFTMLDLERQGCAPINWTPNSKANVLFGIAEAMRYLHANHIIHRDLKPGNILLNDNYEPLVCDFGLSKSFSESSAYQQSMNGGTPLYMAPEIISADVNNPQFDSKIDVYAFGIITYEILTADNPYKDLNEFVVKQKYVNGERPPIPDFVPHPYRRLITECWSQDADMRPTFETIVIQFLRGFFNTPDVDIDKFQDYQVRVLEKDFQSKIMLNLLKDSAEYENNNDSTISELRQVISQQQIVIQQLQATIYQVKSDVYLFQSRLAELESQGAQFASRHALANAGLMQLNATPNLGVIPPSQILSNGSNSNQFPQVVPSVQSMMPRTPPGNSQVSPPNVQRYNSGDVPQVIQHQAPPGNSTDIMYQNTYQNIL